MQSLMWKMRSSSDRVGGGGIGIIVGTGQDTMTMDGLIIAVILPGIEGSLITGEMTIETIGGKDTPGIIVPFIAIG